MKSPVGHLYLATQEAGLSALFLGPDAKQHLFSYLQKMYPESEIQANKPALKQVLGQLDEYFSGARDQFELTLAPEGTPFQKSVWGALQKIPYGHKISYGELAQRLDNPGGMRAVGAANGQNPIPIIIPCHRVIAADGSLGGYTGGLDIKRKLLDLEAQKTTPTLF